jgi:hypothetical protein
MHRNEVPELELLKVEALNCGHTEPTDEQVRGRRYSLRSDHSS